MLGRFFAAVAALYGDQEGAVMTEYVMMAAFIAVVCIAAAKALGVTTNNLIAGSAARFP